MKILSVKPSTCFYVVTDIPWMVNARAVMPRKSKATKALQAIKDCRLFEVSPTPSGLPGVGSAVGLLVAGKTPKGAEKIVAELIRDYGIKV